MGRIYMDCHATTPCDPRVVEAMAPYFTERFGNAASRQHAYGREAHEAVERAREQVAALIGAQPGEIVFTSGATESDNLAIQGLLASPHRRGNRVVTVATEHRAVLDTCRALEAQGRARVTYLGVDPSGLVRLDDLRAALTEETALVSVMAANNEIGVLQPVAEIGALCAERGVIFHTDATQAAGKIPFDVGAHNVHLGSFTAHKMYGPKGVGALYVRGRNPRVRIEPILHGGGHEQGLRSGTLPVPLIVGFGRAAELCRQEMAAEAPRLLALREKLRTGLLERLDAVAVNGHLERRLPGNLHVSIEHVEIERLLDALGDVAVSSSAACSSAKLEPSHVLRALGVNEALAHRSIRFGLGRFTTEAEVDAVLERVVEAVRMLRRDSPLHAGKTGVSSRKSV